MLCWAEDLAGVKHYCFVSVPKKESCGYFSSTQQPECRSRGMFWNWYNNIENFQALSGKEHKHIEDLEREWQIMESRMIRDCNIVIDKGRLRVGKQ